MSLTGKKRPLKSHIFTEGNTVDFLISKSKIKTEFKANGCYDYVDTPANMVPNPGPNQVLLVENTFTEQAPTRAHEIDERLATYDNDIIASHANTATQINNSGLDQAEKDKQLLLNDIKLADRQFQRTQYAADLEKAYISYRADHSSRSSEHKDKAAKVFEIITNNYSSTVLAPVMDWIGNSQPRRGLYELNEIYSANAAGTEGQMLLYNRLASIKFNGNNVRAHLEDFDILAQATIDSGYHLEPPQLLLHLLKSFKDSNNTDYQDLIKNADIHDWSYTQTRNKIIKQYSNLQLQSNSNSSHQKKNYQL